MQLIDWDKLYSVPLISALAVEYDLVIGIDEDNPCAEKGLGRTT
jgi:hypothetical protein